MSRVWLTPENACVSAFSGRLWISLGFCPDMCIMLPFLEGCVSFLEGCGPFLEGCGPFLEGCGSFLEGCGSLKVSALTCPACDQQDSYPTWTGTRPNMAVWVPVRLLRASQPSPDPTPGTNPPTASTPWLWGHHLFRSLSFCPPVSSLLADPAPRAFRAHLGCSLLPTSRLLPVPPTHHPSPDLTRPGLLPLTLSQACRVVLVNLSIR